MLNKFSQLILSNIHIISLLFTIIIIIIIIITTIYILHAMTTLLKSDTMYNIYIYILHVHFHSIVSLLPLRVYSKLPHVFRSFPKKIIKIGLLMHFYSNLGTTIDCRIPQRNYYILTDIDFAPCLK